MSGSDLMSMYAIDEFVAWFACSFGAEVPTSFQRFLDKHPRGTSGTGGRIYAPVDIVTSTEARGLAGRGVCVVGRAADDGLFLLRATDGKVFVVDERDYSAINATFLGMDACSRLMALER